MCRALRQTNPILTHSLSRSRHAPVGVKIALRAIQLVMSRSRHFEIYNHFNVPNQQRGSLDSCFRTFCSVLTMNYCKCHSNSKSRSIARVNIRLHIIFTFVILTSCRREAVTVSSRPFDLDLWPLTLKVVSESCVTWSTSVLILVFLGLSVLDLSPMYATDRRQTASSLNAPA